MKINEDTVTSHLLVCGSTDNKVTVSISEPLIQESDEEELPVIPLNKTPSFENHFSNLCNNASQIYNHCQSFVVFTLLIYT